VLLRQPGIFIPVPENILQIFDIWNSEQFNIIADFDEIIQFF